MEFLKVSAPVKIAHKLKVLFINLYPNFNT